MLIAGILLAAIAIDGDTLRIGRERVRLLAIDAPEMPGHCRKGRACVPGDPYASKAALSALLRHGPLTVQRIKQDRYGRTVAMVYAGRINLSCAMVSKGHAAYIARWDDGDRLAQECWGR